MNPLADLLRRRIAHDGPVSVADFMATALGHPAHGYYATRDPFGVAGDFTTAPEISQMFGELIGLWCADLWVRIGRPAPVRLVELGPGRGTLMADALRAARSLPGFREAIAVHLVETSPTLRERQAETLPDAGPTWHDRFDEVPDGPALVIANELFDALPIRQFQMTDRGWRERLVAWDEKESAFAFALSAQADPAAALIAASGPPGTIAEICPAGLSLATGIAERIGSRSGGAIVIDYGHGGGTGDSFQAVRGHAFVDPLADPGEADLTAHVDFGALASAARQTAARTFGPITQRAFLEALGIRERAHILSANASPAQRRAIQSGLDRLTGPDAMGNLFKALAIVHPDAGTPAGFT
ncbi:class I SAM-dependent methyltransferase [Inquilinus sp. CAU 1745]|uniref:class I SAM-dependent methyltransferase n=1 Tax=Inquilinus sp. CAU 1745 TaxID=3140369 RepID=UPI00325C179A